ncbi:MAG TPA: alpha/beta fold hydrolase [Candidatus Baltobacteraceae bacterium]|jgi:pimeloyl-ACP methyl ester carboxylesterase|nr:alpha/beta fold hydrolase [Candidatus Baltobacteraceae bacterium]
MGRERPAQSQGIRGLATGDNYTPEDVDAIDNAIATLRAEYRPVRVILVGHSGGAAIAADDAYATALKKRGIDANVDVAPNLEHNILNDDFVFNQPRQFMQESPIRTATIGGIAR